MKSRTRTAYLFMLALLLAGSFLSLPTAQAGECSSASSRKVCELLSQVKSEAVALDQDADRLATWTRTRQVQWRTHAEALNLIRGHINKAGSLLSQLNEARGEASPWQQQAIDRLYPILKELADNTNATINHINDNRRSIDFAPYHEHARACADLASELTTLVSNYVEYGEHEGELQRLQEGLALTAS